MGSVRKALRIAGLAGAGLGALGFASAVQAETSTVQVPSAMEGSAAGAATPLRIVAPAPPSNTLDAQYATLAEAGGQTPSAPAERGASNGQDRARTPTPAVASVGLAHRLVDAAGAYAAYMRNAASIRPGFQSGAHVMAALKAGGGYQPGQLEAGATAYAAIVALQDPAFVQGVRDWAANAPGEAPPVERLFADPGQVLQTTGASEAAALASAAIRAQGEAVLETGKAVKQAAYSVQHQDWSKRTVLDGEARLANLKAEAAVLVRPSDEAVSAALTSAVAFRRNVAEAGPPPVASVTPTIARALTVAALAVLGGAGEENADRLTPLLAEPRTTDCVKMSKLNLYQCMAVAGPEYEDVFCLGQHALMDTGQCLVKAAGAPAPRPALPPTQLAQATSAAPAPSAGQSILVPVAFTTGSGGGH